MRQVNLTKKVAALLLSFAVTAAPLGLITAESSTPTSPVGTETQVSVTGTSASDVNTAVSDTTADTPAGNSSETSADTSAETSDVATETTPGTTEAPAGTPGTPTDTSTDTSTETPSEAPALNPTPEAPAVDPTLEPTLDPTLEPAMEPAMAPASVETVTILHTNDVHGHGTDPANDPTSSIIGYAQYKTLIDEYKAAGNTVVLDAGDVLHGTNFATLSQGLSMIEVMNLVGVDAMTPGNHDFNYGYERLVDLAGLASFPILAANVTKDSDGSHPFATETIITVGGINVGIFGMATPETKTKSNPLNTAGLSFNDVVATASASVASLEAKGADVIVFLSHLGMDLSSPIRTTTVLDQVSGIDVVIDGHSHSLYQTGYDYNGTLIASTGDWLHNVGETTITLTNGAVTGVTSRLLPYATVSAKTPDAGVLALIEAKNADNDVVLQEKVGSTATDLDGVRNNVRTKETNLGDLITDAMLAESGADVALTNGGGIRNSIPAGDITMDQVLQVLPFGNQMTVIEVTGQDIFDAVTFGASDYPNAAGKFPHVAGMSYTIVTEKVKVPDSTGALVEKDQFKEVKDVMVAGEPLDLTKTYKLATNDFMAVGGDGYTMFTGKNQISLHGSLLDIAADYMTSLSVSGPFTYTTSDRISVENLPLVETITILHTNDVHAHGTDPANDDQNGIINYARYKTLIDSYKADKAKGSILVMDAGDVLHGTNFATVSGGQAMVDVLNLLGLDAMTPGNHDFNYGYVGLEALAAQANFPILAANITQDSDGTKPFASEIILDVNGVKVGVFGLATPETQTKSNPKNTEGLTFEDEVATANASIAALEAAGADVIVFLSHLGTDLASPVRTQTLLDQVTGIDLVIDGHSHSLYENGFDYNGTLIASTGDWLHNIGEVTITLTEGVLTDISAQLIPYSTASAYDEDPAVKALLESKIAENEDLLNEVIGSTATKLDGVRNNVRSGETNLGDLITDAMLLETGADVVLTNGGGIRASILPGDITYGDVLGVLPFSNQMTVIEVTGQDILDALIFGTSDYPNPAGKFPHVAGMTFTIVTETAKAADSTGATIDTVRVKDISNVMIGGTPLDLTRTYRLATNDFMAVGGDGYTMFTGKTQITLHGLLLDVAADYISLLSLNGPFTYETDGRIQVVAAAEVSEPTTTPSEPTTTPSETTTEPTTTPSEPTTTPSEPTTTPSEPTTTPSEPTTTPSETTTEPTTTPTSGTAAATTKPTTKPTTTPTTSKPNVPGTGEDQSSVIIGGVLLVIGLALAGSMVIVSKRKKKDE